MALIGPQFTVQSQFDAKYSMYWRDDTSRVFYMDHKATVDHYAADNDTTDFESV